MRCEIGDIVMITSVLPYEEGAEHAKQHLGKIVQIVEYSPLGEGVWITYPEYLSEDGVCALDWDDRELTPIKWSKGIDETLLWVDKPSMDSK